MLDERPKLPTFSNGRLTIHLKFDGESGGDRDEVAFFARHLNAELNARGVPTQMQNAPGAPGVKLHVRSFQIRNRRVSGFSPMVTFTSFAADVSDGSKTVRVAAYSKQGKVPVWSMNEVVEPCFNLPMKIVIDEVAAKVNQQFLGRVSSAEQVSALAARASGSDTVDALSAIYALGFTNQPAAADALAPLTSHQAETFRAAAISGLGTLGSTRHLGLLTQIYQTSKTTSDRYAALKAIGDLGTPEALTFVASARDHAEASEQGDIAEIAALYLDARPPAPPRTAQPPTANAAPAVPARIVASARDEPEELPM